ncbi:MAG: FadR/GntR family transcriptional regulator [Pseudomonadota bacterium]
MKATASIDGMVIPALRRGIRRAPIREQIARSLTDLIAAGLLKPGDELPPERELAAMLEVSRESLRGGLQLLADRGTLDIGQGTRTRVGAMPEASETAWQHEFQDLSDVTDETVLGARLVLEPALARLAAEHIDDATLDRLKKLVEAQRGFDDDPVRFQISDREFHLAIFQASGNPVLVNFASQAYAHAYDYRRDLMKHHDGIALAVVAHESIVEALEVRNPDAAEFAMRTHMKTIETLLANLPSSKRTKA